MKISKTNNSDLKLNNSGFSLLELIVTISIMIVLVAVLMASSSILDTSYARDAERGVMDYITLGRSKSMSVSAKQWHIVITKNDSKYVAQLIKDTLDEETGDVTEKVVSEYNLGNKVTVTFDKSTPKTIDATNKLDIYYNSATGKIDRVLLAGVNQTDSLDDGIGYIGITSGSYKITLKVFYNTGKCERD